MFKELGHVPVVQAALYLSVSEQEHHEVALAEVAILDFSWLP